MITIIQWCRENTNSLVIASNIVNHLDHMMSNNMSHYDDNRVAWRPNLLT